MCQEFLVIYFNGYFSCDCMKGLIIFIKKQKTKSGEHIALFLFPSTGKPRSLGTIFQLKNNIFNERLSNNTIKYFSEIQNKLEMKK